MKTFSVGVFVVLLSWTLSWVAALSSRLVVSPLHSASSATVVEPPPPSTTTVSSWEDLSKRLATSSVDASSSSVPNPPQVTLYRDTNGWCPFCERVWVALRAKNISYQEQLINLRDKPDWYKQLVPTTLVPAVVFHETIHNDDENDNQEPEVKHERRLVWESQSILQALDQEFPTSGPQLVRADAPEYQQAMEATEQLTKAGFTFQFSLRNQTLTTAEKEQLRTTFVTQLDQLDAALAQQQQQEQQQSAGPCFRLGAEFSALDAILIPSLERWRYQMPLTTGLDILENRPHLAAWFETMDSFAPYANRVAGDEYSWTATNAMFLQFFGNGTNGNPEVVQRMQQSEARAQALTQSFATATVQDEFAVEVATKLISNHEAVLQDCTNPHPKSQPSVPRATNAEVADLGLRLVATALLTPSPCEAAAHAVSLNAIAPQDQAEAAQALRTVAARLCVPRDMGAPAAKLFRKVLSIVADRLEEEEEEQA